MPVYAGVIVGYYGKAGWENSLKIKGDLALWDAEPQQTLTSSNG